MNNKVICHECRHGTFRALAGDTTIGRSLGLYGEWSEPEVHLFRQIIQAGDVVLEAGANIGTHTVPLSRMVGDGGVVHAFEPMNINHRLLSANLLDNGCFNVKTYQVALGGQPGVVEFADIGADITDNFGAFGFYSTHGAPKAVCPQLTVDELHLKRLDLLKIDTEGHERDVVEGAMATIRRCRPTLHIESLNHYAASLSKDGHVSWLIQKLQGHDYRFWHYITPLFLADNWRGRAGGDLDGTWSFDLVAVPKERGVLAGLANAETHPLGCTDPDQWRRVSYTRGADALVSHLSTAEV